MLSKLKQRGRYDELSFQIRVQILRGGKYSEKECLSSVRGDQSGLESDDDESLAVITSEGEDEI